MKHMKHTMTVLTIVLTLFIATGLHAQVINSTAVTEEPATQLVFWFADDDFADETSIRVVNTSTSSVTLHIQMWVSNDGGGTNLGEDICFETNFTDTFTPNDIHTYEMDDVLANTNPCLTGGFPESCGDNDEIVDLPSGSDDTGFITITPVMGPNDRRAIAFNHLIGTVDYDDDNQAARVNAFGRKARSFIDGSLLADGTLLDGVTAGLVLIQPDVLKFNFTEFDIFSDGLVEEANIVTFMFNDNYNFFGDYSSQPSSATFTPLIFNDTEVPVSCQIFTPFCIIDQGLNDEIVASNTDLPGSDDEGVICRNNTTELGWMRLSVTLPDATTNVFGVAAFRDDGSPTFAYAYNMAVEGEDVIPSPATPTPTAEPSATPTPDGSGTPTGGGTPNGSGGGSSCAISGPVQAGTAFANMLIVLLPAVGFALRRKFKKS